MAGPLRSWWPLAASSSAPAEQLEDLDDILKEPGADADLPVSRGSSSKVLESPGKLPQHWHAHGPGAAALAAPAARTSSVVGGTGSSGGWSSYVPSAVAAWLPAAGMPGHEVQAQPQQQPQPQARAAAAAPTELWRHFMPASLGGNPAEAAPASAEARAAAPSAAASVANQPHADASRTVAAAPATAAAAAAAWAAAAQHQLSSAWGATATSMGEHVTAGSVGASALGAAVGGVAGLVAGPLGVAVGAKSGAALGAIGGVAFKHACDKRGSSTLAALAAKSGMERELQPMAASSTARTRP